MLDTPCLTPHWTAPDPEPGCELPDLNAWLGRDLDRLVMLCERLPPVFDSMQLRSEAARAAHDIKGLATTYGFPVLAALCHKLEALCRREPWAPVRRPLIQLHAYACLACVREGYTGKSAKPILSAVLVGLETARATLD